MKYQILPERAPLSTQSSLKVYHYYNITAHTKALGWVHEQSSQFKLYTEHFTNQTSDRPFKASHKFKAKVLHRIIPTDTTV